MLPAFKTVVVIHPGAIGDAVMGTPVAGALRTKFPQAEIIYLTHPSLHPLLELTGVVNSFLNWQRQTSVFRMARWLRECQADLVIDLVGSLRTRAVAWLSGARTLTYSKSGYQRQSMHLVDHYLLTLKTLAVERPARLFPTLTPPAALVKEITETENLEGADPLVTFIPGVGKHRPNRGWPAEYWAELGQRVLSQCAGKLILVGGTDDESVCNMIHSKLGAACVNLAGRLTLPETAAALSISKLVVSADTGPAHMAVAVGNRVVCMMGPTAFARTGPYGMQPIGIDVADACRCRNSKRCRVAGAEAAGDCMRQISVEEVLSKIMVALKASADGKRVND